MYAGVYMGKLPIEEGGVMHICSDDYVVIDKYSGDNFRWIDEVDTPENAKTLLNLALKLQTYFCVLALISVEIVMNKLKVKFLKKIGLNPYCPRWLKVFF